MDNIHILNKIKSYCAIQERCSEDIRKKLTSLGLEGDETETIMDELVKNGFVDDQRYAIQYAGGKFRMKHWGRLKIYEGLSAHAIPEEMIVRALEEIDDSDYLRTMMDLIEKQKGKKADNEIVRELINKGYEEELILELIEK